jgi:hypothetical protein
MGWAFGSGLTVDAGWEPGGGPLLGSGLGCCRGCVLMLSVDARRVPPPTERASRELRTSNVPPRCGGVPICLG